MLETESCISACTDSPVKIASRQELRRLARMEAKRGVPVYPVSFSTPARIDCRRKTR